MIAGRGLRTWMLRTWILVALLLGRASLGQSRVRADGAQTDDAPAGQDARGVQPGEADGKSAARAEAKAHAAKKKARARARRKRAQRERAKKKRRAKRRRAKARSARSKKASMAKGWHAAPEEGDCPELQASAPGSWGMLPVGSEQCFVLPPIPDLDAADGEAVNVAQSAFANKRNGATHTVHPRLLAMLYRAVREFEVPYVHLVSGFRPGRNGSRHTHGLAADVVLPGVPNARLAAFMRGQGFMGVGIYMRTGFVHLDVRERSYFWLDWSPPGKRWRGKQVRADEAKQADSEALERGEAAFEPPPKLRTALDARSAQRAKKAARKKQHRAKKSRAHTRERSRRDRADKDDGSKKEKASHSSAARRPEPEPDQEPS